HRNRHALARFSVDVAVNTAEYDRTAVLQRAEIALRQRLILEYHRCTAAVGDDAGQHAELLLQHVAHAVAVVGCDRRNGSQQTDQAGGQRQQDQLFADRQIVQLKWRVTLAHCGHSTFRATSRRLALTVSPALRARVRLMSNCTLLLIVTRATMPPRARKSPSSLTVNMRG